jgi:hypothetical protein
MTGTSCKPIALDIKIVLGAFDEFEASFHGPVVRPGDPERLVATRAQGEPPCSSIAPCLPELLTPGLGGGSP